MVQTSSESSPYRRRRTVTVVLDVLLALTATGAVASLVMEHGGFDPPPVPIPWLHTINAVIVGLFVLDRIVRLLIAPARLRYLKQNWLDFALLAGLGISALVLFNYARVLSVSALYVIISEAYILIALVLRLVGVNIRLTGSGIPPSWLLIGSFLFLCLAGSGLLMLPAATPGEDSSFHRPLYYIDALFTAVSATCVTGLIVRDTGMHFTRFGQGVILLLIQLGGLGIMMFGTMVALLAGKGLGIRESNTLGKVFNTQVGALRRVVQFVIFTTLCLEAIGAIAMYPMFAGMKADNGATLSTAEAVWYSVFHSVSAFCNAGFGLYHASLMGVRGHVQVLGVFAPLIVLGGLGFPVLQDLARAGKQMLKWLWRTLRGRPHRGFTGAARRRLSLHTRIVLVASAVLIVLGAAVLMGTETPADTGAALGRHSASAEAPAPAPGVSGLPLGERVGAAVFQSLTARTAGFNTVDMDELSPAGKLWMCMLMIVGGSPASTAGGLKTVCVAVLVIAAISMLRRRPRVEVFRRQLSYEILTKALTLAILYLGLLLTVTLLLSTDMRDERLIDVFFEACSACGTVGLSTGVTGRLTEFGKGVVIASMLLGRIGPLTLLLALTARIRHIQYSYATESVLVG
jgi:trk system potassium uptake protein TrkH